MAIKPQNANRILVSLTDLLEGWIEKAAEDESLDLPYMGDGTGQLMAAAALNVLQAVSDVYDTLSDNGQLTE